MIGYNLIRSVLVVPGHDGRKIARALSSGADLVVFDLEDAVPEEHKDEARVLVAGSARRGDAVRINSAASPRFEGDLALVRRIGARLMVPKVEVEQLDRIPPSAILTIESPSAVLDARLIAKHSAMVAFGRVDFMAAIGTLDSRSRLVEHAMLEIALAAHAEGKPASDGPCYELGNHRALLFEIARAKDCGFLSKGCIHPDHVLVVANGMRASTDEIAAAMQIIEAAQPIGRSVWSVGMAISPPLVKASEMVAGRG